MKTFKLCNQISTGLKKTTKSTQVEIQINYNRYTREAEGPENSEAQRPTCFANSSRMLLKHGEAKKRSLENVAFLLFAICLKLLLTTIFVLDFYDDDCRYLL